MESAAQAQVETASTTRDQSSEESARPHSKLSSAHDASNEKKILPRPPTTQAAPTFPQLTPLLEVPPLSSAIGSAQHDASLPKETGEELNTAASSAEKSPPTSSGDERHLQPAQTDFEPYYQGSGTDSNATSSQRSSENTMDIPPFPEPKSRQKPINFSRPLPRSPI